MVNMTIKNIFEMNYITYQLNSFSPTEHLRGSEKSFKYSELTYAAKLR